MFKHIGILRCLKVELVVRCALIIVFNVANVMVKLEFERIKPLASVGAIGRTARTTLTGAVAKFFGECWSV